MEIKLSAFADEASAKVSEQIEALQEEGIPYVELRGLDGKNVANLSEQEAEGYRKQFDEGGISVWAIGSPLGKTDVYSGIDEHMKKAEHVFKIAKIFGTEKIRMFSFFTNHYDRDENAVLNNLKRMAELADKHGVVLYHENEKGIFGDNAARCRRLLDNVKNIRCVFDPANFVQCGQDISDALDLLEKDIAYYHVKDALYDGGAVVPAGCGDGKLGRVIAGIRKDTVLTVEPHLTVFKGYEQIDSSELKHKYVYESPRKAFAAAVATLKKLLKENGYKEVGNKWIK